MCLTSQKMSNQNVYEEIEVKIKPFLKWAGGKTQLIKEISKYYPFGEEPISKYAEPFVGGGAVLFDVLSKFDLKEVYISDINLELINTYQVIRDDVDSLIEVLACIQSEYLPLEQLERKKYYLEKRDRYNKLINIHDKSKIEKSALMIFLNKTCFNGLYRVNKKGFFNVPMGYYKRPLICDEENLRNIGKKLQHVIIKNAHYSESFDFIDQNTFVYFDPPYRPLSKTASFTSYTENDFNDEEQIKLAKYFDRLNQKGAKILLSNSDPKNSDPEDNFFDVLYSQHVINRVHATRMINSNSFARGKIKELLISNFRT